MKRILAIAASMLMLSVACEAVPTEPEELEEPEAEGFVYLSDLEWEHAFFAHDVSYEGRQGEPCPELSVWKDRNQWGGPIELHGVVYEKGLVIRHKSSLSYHLNGDYTVFETDLGVYTHGYRWNGFDLYGDDVLLYSSPEIRVDTPTLRVRVPVNDVNILKVNVITGQAADLGVLADAKLYYNTPLENVEERYLLEPGEWFVEMRRPVNVWAQSEAMKVTVVNGGTAEVTPLLKYRFSNSDLLMVGQRAVAMRTDGQNLIGEIEAAMPKLNGIYKAEFELEYGGKAVAAKEFVFGVISDRNSDVRSEDSIFGVNAALSQYSGFRLSECMRQIGVKWVRYVFEWNGIERINDSFDFSLTDELIDEIREQDLGIVGVLGHGHGIPLWASEKLPGSVDRYPPGEDDWVDYVSRVVERYKDDIEVWEFWNEPGPGVEPPRNLGWNYTHYEKLLKATHETIKAIDPEAKLIQGLHEPVESNEVIFKDGFGDYCEGLVLHPYREPYAPEDKTYNPRTSCSTASTFKEDIANAGDLIQKYGGDQEIWFTEIGWWGSGHEPWGGPGNTMQEQSDYLARTYVLALSTGLKPRVFYHSFFDCWRIVNGMMEDEWGFPFPALLAYANAANQLEGAEYAKTLEMSDGNIFAYLFETDESDVYVLWTAKHDRWINMTGEIDKVSVFDKLGNPPQTIEQEDGISILLQGSPVFLRVGKGSTLAFQILGEGLSLEERTHGCELILADGFRSLKSMVIDSSTIYIAEAMIDGSIYSLSTDAKNLQTLVGSLSLPTSLAVDSSNLYFSEWEVYRAGKWWYYEFYSNYGMIRKLTLATGDIEDLPLTHPGCVFSIGVASTYVYLSDESRASIARVPVSAGDIEHLCNGSTIVGYGAGGQWCPDLAYVGQAMSMLVTESDVYWSVGHDIYARPTADDGLITKLTSFAPGEWWIGHIPSMSMDSEYIYFVDIRGGFVRKVPLSGGDVTTLTGSNIYGSIAEWSSSHPNSIAVDDNYVYWSELGFHSAGGSINRMPKAGGAITTLIDGLGEVGGIALDDDYVYWTEGDSVKKIAKGASAPTFSPTISTSRTESPLGHAIAITGQLSSAVEVSDVTLEYSRDNGQTWSFIAELSTDPDGEFSYSWLPPEEGTYLVGAVWNPNVRFKEVRAESQLIDVAAGDS